MMIPYRGLFTTSKNIYLEYYNEDRVVAIHYLFFNIFDESRDFDSAYNWVKKIINNHANTLNIHTPFNVKFIPYLLKYGQCDAVFSVFDESRKSLLKNKDKFSYFISDEDFFNFYVLPCIIKALTEYLRNEESGMRLLNKIYNKVSEYNNIIADSLLLEGYLLHLSNFIKNESFDRNNITNVNNFENEKHSAIQMLVYILTSMHSEIKDAFELQFVIIVNLDKNMSSLWGESLYLFIVSFFETFWKQQFLKYPNSFENVDFLRTKGIALIESKSGQERLKAIFRVCKNHISGLTLNEHQEGWCDL